MKSIHTWVVVGLLAATVCLTEMRGDTDKVPPSRPLTELPQNFGNWHGRDLPIAPESLEILGKGVFLNRTYAGAPEPGERVVVPVGLFIGYFPTQRTGQSIHSPQNCLPGSGWSFDSSGTTEWTDGSGKYQVGEYLISNGIDRQEVFYWYRTHGQNIANDYVAKLHMLADSVVYNRTDAALIRVITPLVAGESQADAHKRALRFTQTLVPLLPAYIPD